jgi:hypothetical protein
MMLNLKELMDFLHSEPESAHPSLVSLSDSPAEREGPI